MPAYRDPTAAAAIGQVTKGEVRLKCRLEVVFRGHEAWVRGHSAGVLLARLRVADRVLWEASAQAWRTPADVARQMVELAEQSGYEDIIVTRRD